MEDHEQIQEFFEKLHGDEPAGHLIIWTRSDKATRSFDLRATGALSEAVEYCAARAATTDVYAAVGLQKRAPAAGGRGTEDGVAAIPGLWADIDVAGPAHKSRDLPSSEEEARELITSLELPPSIIVRSGFGLQAYWQFKEPWLLENGAERAAAKSLSVRFQKRLRQIARGRGWKIDPTADLCRVLRVPGTFNRKIRGDARPVTADYSDWAYNVDDFEAILEGIEDPGPVAHRDYSEDEIPPAQLEPILDGCSWMRRCRDDAKTLPEPEWYRMLSVVARCERAAEWAHKLSRSYPGYKPQETNSKLRQASSTKVAPVTCAYVETDLAGERYCSQCLFRGHVNSPIAIGRLEVGESEAPSEDPSPTNTSLPEPAPEPESPPAKEAKKATHGVSDADVAALASTIERFTDLGNAKRFVARYRDRVRYCDKFAKWFVWDDKRWEEDETLLARALATDLVRSLYALAKRIKDVDERTAFLKHIIKSEAWSSLAAMLNIAKSDPILAVRTSDLDSDPWLLTVNNGTIDLRTGKIRSHNPAELISKLAPVTYDPDAVCPNWLEFLNLVMDGRQELVDFLQRAFGTCLTGITSDKAMFILYGAGGDNGKSSMVDVIQCLLGNYARRTPVETFMRKKEGAIPNDVARLKGARFVWASENERGSRLSESLIKDMTGGDKITARFMRGEFFEFYPEFKPWLATNHKPQVRGDKAIWNRLKLIPFTVTIPQEAQKPRHEVMATFRAELPGILHWAVQGCLAWQRDGLGVPEEVIEATKEYETEQDTFGAFLRERCICVPNARASSIALYKEYKSWAEDHGEMPVSHKMFSSFLSERGFERTRSNRGMVHLGVGLRTPDRYDQPDHGDSRARAAGRDHLDHDDDEGEVV